MASVTITTGDLARIGGLALAGALPCIGFFATGAPFGVALLGGVVGAAGAALVLEGRERRRHDGRIERALGLLLGRLEQVATQVVALEDRIRGVELNGSDHARTEIVQTAAEIEMLGTIVKELAQTLAQHDAERTQAAPGATDVVRETVRESVQPTMREIVSSPSTDIRVATSSDPERRVGDALPDTAMTPVAMTPVAVTPVAVTSLDTTPAAITTPDMIALVEAALGSGAYDIHLQPVVSLPQRRVKFYEALTRLRTAGGQTLAPGDFLPAARQAGLIGALDRGALEKSLLILRRLLNRNRDIALFVNLDEASLIDTRSLGLLASLLQANRDIAAHVLLEISQDTMRALGSAGFERLRPVTALGYRFSMDRIGDLRFDPRALFDHGFRHLKVPADLLLRATHEASSEIHPLDLAKLLSRNGIQLIATGIETEKTVLELLDCDVRFAQGFVFSPPRPVRPDVTIEAGAGEQGRHRQDVHTQDPQDQDLRAAGQAQSQTRAQSLPPPERVPYRSVLRRAAS